MPAGHVPLLFLSRRRRGFSLQPETLVRMFSFPRCPSQDELYLTSYRCYHFCFAPCIKRRNEESIHHFLTTTVTSPESTIRVMKHIKLHPSVVRGPQLLIPCIDILVRLLDNDSCDVAIQALETLSETLKAHWSKLRPAYTEQILQAIFRRMGSARDLVRAHAVSAMVILLKVDPPKVSSEIFRMVKYCSRFQLLALMGTFHKVMKIDYCPKELPFRCIYYFFCLYVESKDKEVRQNAQAGEAIMDFYF